MVFDKISSNEILIVGLIGGILYGAYKKKKIDMSAVIATAIIGSLALLAGGSKWVVPLLVFFVFGNIASHYKKALKEILDVAQKMRTWWNVLGNGLAAGIFAALYIFYPDPLLFIGFMGSMAAALADTLATELGQIYGKVPRLITTLKKVKIGTPGAVTAQGFAFALLGSAIISSLLIIWGYSFKIFLIVGLAGFIGAIIDSVLGATIEKEGQINTHEVNFFCTLVGGFIALAIVTIL